MKSGLGCVFLLSVIVLAGCHKNDYVINEPQYVSVRIDPNSADAFIMAMTHAMNQVAECDHQLMTRIAWIRNSLDKCLEKLEKEKGLEPIARKGETIAAYPDANFILPSKPWYEPYDQGQWHAAMTFNNVNTMIGTMNFWSLNKCNQSKGIDDYIENFEQRMKRLEKYMNDSKDVNASSVKQ